MQSSNGYLHVDRRGPADPGSLTDAHSKRRIAGSARTRRLTRAVASVTEHELSLRITGLRSSSTSAGVVRGQLRDPHDRVDDALLHVVSEGRAGARLVEHRSGARRRDRRQTARHVADRLGVGAAEAHRDDRSEVAFGHDVDSQVDAGARPSLGPARGRHRHRGVRASRPRHGGRRRPGRDRARRPPAPTGPADGAPP